MIVAGMRFSPKPTLIRQVHPDDTPGRGDRGDHRGGQEPAEQGSGQREQPLHKVLLFGIVLALVLRGLFIAVGAASARPTSTRTSTDSTMITMSRCSTPTGPMVIGDWVAYWAYERELPPK